MAANIYVNEIEQEPEECVVHQGLQIKAVCNACEEPVCFRCLLDAHNGHPITDLQEAREEVCEALLRHRRALKQHIKRMEGQIKDLTDKEMENDRECGFALDNLRRTGTSMKSLLSLVLKEMEKEVKEHQEKNRQEISNSKVPLETRLQTASSKLEEVDRLINSDNMYDTLHLEQELRRINASHENGTHAPNIQIPKFEPKKITKEELRDKLGELILSADKCSEGGEEEHEYDYVEPIKKLESTRRGKERSPSPQIVSPHIRSDNYVEYRGGVSTGLGFTTIRKTRLSEGSIVSVCPLTLNQAWTTDNTGKTLRLVSEKGHTVRSVSANTKRSDIALTTDGAVLMTCPDKCCIKKYSQDGTIRIFINTPDYYPHGISIFFETEEIFVGLIDSNTYDVKSYSNRFIQRYSRKGEPLQQITIQRSNPVVSFALGRKVPIVTIPHKVKVNQTTGEVGLVNWTKDHQGQVIVFSSDGKKKFTYPSDNKTQLEPMDIVFTSSNHIIISDAHSCGLQLLDGEGKFVKVLHTFDKPPSALAYFGEGRLWVGNSEGELIVTHFPEPEWNPH